ncbi:hypothetical protein [Pararhodobacter sp.]
MSATATRHTLSRRAGIRFREAGFGATALAGIARRIRSHRRAPFARLIS